jgi:hypothetical protein
MDARLSGLRTVGTFDLKLELDQREGRTVSRCLLACRSPLIESVLRKLRLFDQTHDQPQIDAD